MVLKDYTALVTGASRGIGREIALAFARAGADLAIAGRSSPDLETLKEQIIRMGVRCVTAVADLFERDAVDETFATVAGSFDHVNILVNNAGIGSSVNPKPVIDFDDKFWEQSLYLNLTVPYLFCKKVLPAMAERCYGRIINIASIAGKVGVLHGAAYSASKHGLLGLTRSLAVEVAKQGITVNALCPAAVRTTMNNQRMAYDAKRIGKTVAELESTATPIGRRIAPQEITPLAVYLASKESAAITGQAFNIDGGILML